MKRRRDETEGGLETKKMRHVGAGNAANCEKRAEERAERGGVGKSDGVYPREVGGGE